MMTLEEAESARQIIEEMLRTSIRIVNVYAPAAGANYLWDELRAAIVAAIELQGQPASG